MIVVSDTSAITSLIQIDRVELLQRMYGKVLVPHAVEQELRCAHATMPPFIETVFVRQPSSVTPFLSHLQRGEAEAIVLAMESKADVLLIDEKKGRAAALREGVPVIGLIGVLTAAKMKGFVSSLTATLRDLETKADFRMSDELKSRALQSVGE